LVRKDKTRVNIRARLNRHLRIVKENIWGSDKKKILNTSYDYNLVLFIVLLIIPIYPTFASYMYDTSRYDFYRWNIDESSIIESYYAWNSSEANINTPILETTDSFISVNTILDDERDLEWTNEIVDYEVKPGDSFSVIAYKYRVSTNSILWANNFSKKHTLHPWEIIKIPPVSWLIHQVIKWDTLSSIAKKYDTAEEKIITQNNLDKWSQLVIGDVLTIPWAIKKIPKPVYRKPVRKTYYKRSSWSQYVNTKWKFKMVWRKPYSWVGWNCTWFVASYKNVDWRWNANRWIANAKAKWHKVSMTPKIWSIVQFTGRWYNRRYWHVAIVVDVTSTHIIVKDMNYRKLYEVTTRKIKLWDRTIDWYIYVN
jgi:surface antigen